MPDDRCFRLPKAGTGSKCSINAMETIVRFHKGEDAYLFRSFLESEGISAHVFDEYTPQAYWLYTHAIGGIRVVVNTEDAKEAAQLFRAYEENVNAEPAVVGDVKVWPVVLLVSYFVGVPFFLFGRKTPKGSAGGADEGGDKLRERPDASV
jgi:hypothetical protein